MSEKIAVIFTGGTIGSIKQGDSINVNEKGSYALVDAYRKANQQTAHIEFDTLQPLNILSENMTGQEWFALAKYIHGLDVSSYEGIIVTHGSDTLAYASAMLGYLLSNSSIPIVLIASNYPLEDVRSNGLRNFGYAIEFITSAKLPGVFSIYENDKGQALVYLATRMMQCEPFTDQFRSPYEIIYGEMRNGAFLWNKDSRNPVPHELSPVQYDWLNDLMEKERVCTDFMYIKPYPGLDYRFFSWRGHKPRLILHDVYHSGTACAIAEHPYALIEFIQQCNKEGIDVYLAPIKSEEEALYASTAQLTEAGAIILEGISVEAAMTKLMLAMTVHESNDKVREWMKQRELYYENHRVQ